MKKIGILIALLGIGLAPLVGAQTYSDLVAQDNPLVYWRFSNDLVDTMGNVALNPAASPAFVDSPLAGSKAYSSSGGKAWAAAFGASDLMDLYDFTYEMWINLSGVNEGSYLLQRYGGGEDRGGENSLMYQNGGITFLNTGPGVLVDQPFAELPDETDQWVHLAVVSDFDAATITIYINGAVAFVGESYLEPYYGGNDFEIYLGARRQNPGDTVMDGALDEVAIYGTPLSETQITAHYQARTSAAAYTQAVKADSPLGYWRFEGNYNDEMGSNHLLPSGVQFVPGPGGSPNTALFGRITSNAGQILYDNIDAFSYELWFNPIFKSAGAYIFFRRPGTAQHAVIYAYKTDMLEFFFMSNSDRPAVTIPNETDRWYHCVVVNDPSVPEVRFYIDGELALQHPGAVATGTGDLVVIGGSDQGDNFNGYIDEVAMYNYVLTDAQIQAHYNAPMNPVSVGSWSLY